MKAKFRVIKTDKTIEAEFDGAVYTEVTDSSKRKYKVNTPDADVVFVEHTVNQIK
jgi:hypothetical protein